MAPYFPVWGGWGERQAYIRDAGALYPQGNYLCLLTKR